MDTKNGYLRSRSDHGTGITKPDRAMVPPTLLRVLILEDSPSDAQLMVSVLERGGFRVQFEVMESAESFRKCLEKTEYDVILADFNLRSWTALDALEIVKRSGKDLPLLVVTGTVGDEAAAECIQQGAADFVLKDRPARLPAAVQRALEEKHLRSENERASEAISRLATIVESSDEAIVGKTLEGVITSWNKGAEKLYGYASAEVLGQPISVLVPPDRPEESAQILARLSRGERVEPFESVRVRKDRSLVDVSLSMFPLTGFRGDVIGAASIALDITDRKRAQMELRRLNRALRTITECNQIIVRATEESSLLEDMCGILVREGGYLMAWVGYREHDEGKSVRPIAHAGFEEGYLQTLSITWADTERGRGPTGTAIRTGRPVVARNVQSEPCVALWRQEAIKRGYGSSIALPILLNDQVLGALSIYAEEPDAFASEEIHLLTKLADDLAYGIQTFRTRAERKRAEEALNEERRLLHTLMDNLPDLIYFKDCEGRFTRINLALAKKLDLDHPAQAIGKTDFDFFPAERANEFYNDEERIIRTGEPMVGKEEKVAWPDGQAAWDSTTKMPLRDAQGNIVGTFGVSRDITERKLAEAKNARLAVIVNSSDDAIFSSTREGFIETWNAGAERMYGYAAEEIKGKHFSILVPEDCRADLAGITERLLRGEALVHFEREDIRRDGSRLPVLLTLSPIKDDTGFVTGVSVISHDITERKRAEEEIGHLATFPMLNPQPVIEVDMGGRVCFMNDAARQLLPDSVELAIDHPLLASLPAVLDACRRGAELPTCALHIGNRWYEQIMHHVRDAQRVRIYSTEVTDRKRAEEALQNEKAFTESIIDSLPDTFYVIDSNGRYLRWNQNVGKALGYSSEEFAALDPLVHIPEDERPLAASKMQEAWVKGSAVADLHVLTKDGRKLPYLLRTTRALIGGKAYLVGLGVDITERKRAEDALRASEEQYREVFENAKDIVYTDDLRGNVTSLNRAGEELTGYSREEVVRMNVDQILAPESLEAARELSRRLLAGEKVPPVVMELVRKDGRHLTVEVAVRLLTRQGKPVGFEGIARDITERRQLEQQLRQAQKMEAVGRLAGGVAHDFNNLLTIINGYAQILTQRSSPDDPRRGLLEEIRMAGEKAASLTRQLLAFSRRQVMEARVLDLSGVVANIEKMLRRLIGEDIELVTTLRPDLEHVKVDPGQIEQVIMNLAINARDAMPQGGKLLIETSNVEINEDYARRRHTNITPGKYVMLAVGDTGCGMDSETQAHIFEPFFTTKVKGQGTGLGLATVYGIIKQSGGFIWVDSEPGQGSTFKIYFPCVKEALPTAEPAKVRPTKLTKAKETVLVAEDESGVRTLVCEALRSVGYHTLEATGAAEALKLAEQHKDPIHLLLTDVVMPHTGGKELALRLSALHPESKLLYISGYTDDTVVRHGILEGDMPFLQKPFLPDVLLRKVRAVLKMKRQTRSLLRAASSSRICRPAVEAR